MINALYICPKDGEDLGHFVLELEKILQLGDSQLRESSNYLDGICYLTGSLGVALQIGRFKTIAFDKYEFQLSFSTRDAWIDNDEFLVGLADLIARILAAAGYSVISVAGSVGEISATIYSLNHDQNVEPGSRIVTQAIKM